MKPQRKGYSRIYVQNAEDIAKVRAIIETLDDFEYEYLPNDYITVFNNKIEYICSSKFYEIDLDTVMKMCWGMGIYAFYVIREERSGINEDKLLCKV